MLKFILLVLLFTAVMLLLMFVVGALLPVLTHPITTIVFCVAFVVFAVSVYKGSNR